MMKDRIRQLMETQHMNQQAFSKYTKIGSASLSSIFTGRTRPSMNHVLAILEAFPNVSPVWLLKGEGGMLLTNENSAQNNGENSSPSNGAEMMPSDGAQTQYGGAYRADDADKMAEDLPLFGQKRVTQVHPSVLPPVEKAPNGRYTKLSQVGVTQGMDAIGHRKITEIRVFFDDQTWESFVPKNK